MASLMDLPVTVAMLGRLPSISSHQSLEDAASLFVTGRQQLVPVVEDGEAVAVVTKDDVAVGLRRNGPHATVAEAPCHDVVTVTPSESLADVYEKLRARPDAVAVIVAEGEPVGVMTFERLQQYLDSKRAA